MIIKKTLTQNYLSIQRFKHGEFLSIFILLLSLLLSVLYWNSHLEISQILAANYKYIYNEHEIWRLFSSSFIHGDLKHYLSNSLMFFFLSYFVSTYYGLKIYLLLAIFGGAIINAFTLYFYGGEIYLVGASGIIFLLWGFWMMLYLFIQKQFSVVQRMIRIFGVFIILLIPNEYDPNTSYLAHYFGYFLGGVFGIGFYFLNKIEIHSFEKWLLKYENPELSELDKIALGINDEDS